MNIRTEVRLRSVFTEHKYEQQGVNIEKNNDWTSGKQCFSSSNAKKLELQKNFSTSSQILPKTSPQCLVVTKIGKNLLKWASLNYVSELFKQSSIWNKNSCVDISREHKSVAQIVKQDNKVLQTKQRKQKQKKCVRSNNQDEEEDCREKTIKTAHINMETKLCTQVSSPKFSFKN